MFNRLTMLNMRSIFNSPKQITQDTKKKQACCTGCKRRPSPNEAPPIGKLNPFSKLP